MTPIETDSAPAASRWRRWARRLAKGVLALTALPALYFGTAEILMRIPVNADADPLAGDVPVYCVVGGPHVDIWVPVEHEAFPWREFLPPDLPLKRLGYLSFGWGDRAFYTQVPTWDDLTVGVAFRGALLPSSSAVRVISYQGPPEPGAHVSLLRLDRESYKRLCEYIAASFGRSPEGLPVPIEFEGYGFGLADRFFEGDGSYHMFQTCNTWTNRAVQVAGKRAALWAPLVRGTRHHLPQNGGRF